MNRIFNRYFGLAKYKQQNPLEEHKRKTLNALVWACAFMAVFVMAVAIILKLTIPNLEPDQVSSSVIYAGLILLAGIVVIVLLQRFVSYTAASLIFTLLVIAAIFLSDSWQELANGRSLIALILPVVIASVLLRPWAGSVVAASFCAFIIIFQILYYRGGWPNVPAIAMIILVALIIQQATSNLEQVIQQHEQTKKNLQENEERFRALIESSSDLTAILSHEGRIDYISTSVERMLGYKAESLIGRNIIDYVNPEDYGIASAALGPEVPAEVIGPSLKLRLRHVDGSWVFVEAIGKEMHSHPAIQGTVINCRNITERIQAETKLHESEEIFSTAFRLSPMPMAIAGSEGEYIEVNQAFSQSLGYPYEEMVGHTPSEVNIFADPEQNQQAVRMLREQGKLQGYEMDVRTRSGEILNGVFYAEPMHLNTQPMILTLMIDNTERKRVENELRTSEEQYRHLIETIPIGVAVHQAGQIQLINPAGVKILGAKSAEQLICTNVSELGAPEDRERIQERIRASLSSDGQVEGVVEKLRKFDGTTFDAKIVVQPIRFKEETSRLVLFSDITEQKHTENMLKKSEENFRNLAENTADGILIGAPDGRIIYANQQTSKLLGYRPEEVIRLSQKDISDPASYPFLKKNLKDRLAGKPLPETYETTLMRKDGTCFPVEIAGASTIWQEQSCVLVLIRDITERKQAEEALKTSEENFRNLSDNIMDGIIIVTSEGRHVYANPRACDLLQYSLEEILDLSQKDLADPSAYPILKQRLEDRLAGRPIPATYEIIARRKDGTCFPVEISGTRTIWRGQVCDLVLSRDITERKQAEAAIKKSAENFRNLSENTADGILIGAPDGRHIYANRQACELLGYSPEEILRTTQEDISDPAMQPLLEKRLQDRIAGRPAPKRYEINLRHKDGTYFPVEISGTRTIWQEEVSDLVLFRDITERKQTQEAIRVKNERIQEVSRQLVEVQEHEKRKLASDLHDDLGQSLTSLKLMLELASSTRATNKQEKMLGSSIELISELMGKVRNLSLELRPAMLDDFGLFATLRWLFERFQAQTKIVIQCNYDPDSEQRFPPEVETAAFRIIQEALTNVARHAGVKEAKVTIEIGESLSIEIADHGTGFGYLPETQNPTGSVGLSSMQERARLLGGQVEIVSEKGVGTRVVAMIPLTGVTP